MGRILAEQKQSLEILVFLCLPLSLMLMAAITLAIRSNPGYAITCPTFSMTITTLGHAGHGACVAYRGEDQKSILFHGDKGRGQKFYTSRIRLIVPKELPDDVVREVVPNLAMGLAKLRWEYVICRAGEPQGIVLARSDSSPI